MNWWLFEGVAVFDVAYGRTAKTGPRSEQVGWIGSLKGLAEDTGGGGSHSADEFSSDFVNDAAWPRAHDLDQDLEQVSTGSGEFQTQELLPEGDDASAIIGIVGSREGFAIEARLNRAPLKEDLMSGWLERLIGQPVSYAPLPAFI